MGTVGISSNGLLFFRPVLDRVDQRRAAEPISNDPFFAFFWDDLQDFGAGEYLETRPSLAPGRVFYLYFRMRPRLPSCAAPGPRTSWWRCTGSVEPE